MQMGKGEALTTSNITQYGHPISRLPDNMIVDREDLVDGRLFKLDNSKGFVLSADLENEKSVLLKGKQYQG